MNIKNLLLVALVLGCGAQADGYDDEGAMGEVSSDYGQAEQPLGIQGNGAAGWTMGVLSNASPALSSCTIAQGTNAKCRLPRNRIMNYCIAMLPQFGGFTSQVEVGEVRAALAPNVTAINNQVNAFGDPSTNWVLTVSPTGATCPTTDITHSTVLKAAVGGSLGNVMSDYVRVSFDPLQQAVAESPANYPGEAFVNGGVVIEIDLVDIKNKGANASQDSFLLQHATTKGALAGIGVAATGANSGFATANVPQLTGFSEMTAGQACRLDKYTTVGTTLTWVATSSCQNN